MTVYVDDMRMPARVGRIQARWSHLMADTDEELHAFAAGIGLRRSWAQHPGTWRSHYDVTDSKRAEAIRAGAVEIGYGSAESLALTARANASTGHQLGRCSWTWTSAETREGVGVVRHTAGVPRRWRGDI